MDPDSNAAFETERPMHSACASSMTISRPATNRYPYAVSADGSSSTTKGYSSLSSGVWIGVGRVAPSPIAGGIGALRGPKHGGANEVAFEVQKRYETPDDAEADIRRRVEAKEVVIGFGHPVYTIADPRNKVIKEVARRLSSDAGDMKMLQKRCSPIWTGFLPSRIT